MNVNDTVLIEKYLAGELSNEEAQAFELRLETDSEFADNFIIYQAIENEMHSDQDESALKEELSLHTKKYFGAEESDRVIPIEPARKRRWIYAAVAVAACITALLVFRPWQDDRSSCEELSIRPTWVAIGRCPQMAG